jgi:hypothetical protein
MFVWYGLLWSVIEACQNDGASLCSARSRLLDPDCGSGG